MWQWRICGKGFFSGEKKWKRNRKRENGFLVVCLSWRKKKNGKKNRKEKEKEKMKGKKKDKMR